MWGDLTIIAIMVFGVALLIRWGAWILANLDDALGDEATTQQTGGGGPSISAGRRGTQTQQHIHPSSHDGEASL